MQTRASGAVSQYITLANTIKDKIEKSILDNIDIVSKNKRLTDLIEEDLVFFMAMITKHVDLLERRVIKKEIIPNSEKLYSIF